MGLSFNGRTRGWQSCNGGSIPPGSTIMFNFLKSRVLLIVVFITGACVLILEVLATRLMSPYFGNTIFTVSSVIGVVLAALSGGYYIGGNMADREPTSRRFYLIILLSGLSTFILQIFSVTLLPYMGYKLPITYGPLLSSILLFTLPSLLLGTLSPYVIALEKSNNKKKGIGKVSGEIFFVSTLGSIFGTFLAGFYLIPTFGLGEIIMIVAFTLSGIGIVGIIKSTGNLSKKKFIDPKLTIILCILASVSISSDKLSLPNYVYSKDGVYEKISVVDRIYKDKPARILIQDRSYSSAIYPDNPNELVFGYTKYINLYKPLLDKPKNALFIGGGAYMMPTYLIRNVPDIKVDVTEIEPELYNVVKKYFWIRDTWQLSNHIEDGRRFLRDSSQKYDLIFSDVYSTIYSIPAHFTTIEFFELAKSHLSSDGIFLANIIGDLSRQKPSITFSEIKTFRKVFPNSYFFAVESPAKIGTQNLIFLGLNKNEPLNLADIQNKYKDDEVLGTIANNLINLERFKPEEYQELTDNYSPIESITKSLIERDGSNLTAFNGTEALQIIKQQVDFGSRHVGSQSHDKILRLIDSETTVYADMVVKNEWSENIGGKDYNFTNIVGRIDPDNKNRIVLGTHYDSLVDNLGANNSASGVSVLLELMRILRNSESKPKIGIDFVFFDGEEGLPGQTWKPYGSVHFAKEINKLYPQGKPDSVLIVDMVCDRDLDIYYEKSSQDKSQKQNEAFFSLANNLYPGNFHKLIKYGIDDDHTAFNSIGIPSILIIDYDYPYYNTSKDTADKCSVKSLEKVGNSILKYVYSL